MPAPSVDDATWDADVLATIGVVIVAFWSRSSTPCRDFLAVVDALDGHLRGRARVLTIDVEDNAAVGRRYDVSSLPTVLMFRRGMLAARVVGTRSEGRLLRELWSYPA